MRRLFIIDYKENGEAMHQCIEAENVGMMMPDTELIASLHAVIGANNELHSIIEVFADMNAYELNKIAMTSKMSKIPYKVLYVNMDEIIRIRSQMGLPT